MKTEIYKCPNCGAELNINTLQPVQQCRCSYCGTVVTFKDEDYSRAMSRYKVLEDMRRNEATEKVMYCMDNGDLGSAYELAAAYREEYAADPIGYKMCLAIVCMCDLGDNMDDIKEVEDMIEDEWLLFRDACFEDADYAMYAELVCDAQSYIKRRKILYVLSKIMSPIFLIAGILLSLLGIGYIIAASILGGSVGGFVFSVVLIILGIILFVIRYIFKCKIYIIENLLDRMKRKSK